MAADLAASPSTGIELMCCGDAHVSNFGMYAAPHRSIVFDLNDFDEAAVAPAEWDVKRLITSAIIGGRHAGYPGKAIRRCVEEALVGYQTSLQAMLEEMSVLDRYYLRVEPEHYTGKVSKGSQALIQKTISRARTRTSARVFKQITEIGPEGTPRLRESPPVLQHVDEEIEAPLVESVQEYLAAVPADVALLLSHFRVTDVALRVVGVGSVGTRCYLVILVGPNDTPMILLSIAIAIVAAANPPEQASDGWDLSAPLANRFVHLDWRATASSFASLRCARACASWSRRST